MEIEDGVLDLMVSGFCDSPIEVKFLRAYLKLLHQVDSNWHITRPEFNSTQLATYNEIPRKLKLSALHHLQTDFIWTQFVVDPYRVDFALARVAYQVDFSGGQPGDEILVKTPLVVVECDGHDFHERTKEQAQRDKSRDRILVGEGLTVLRFTGSELHRDADRCAREVNTILISLTASVARE